MSWVVDASNLPDSLFQREMIIWELITHDSLACEATRCCSRLSNRCWWVRFPPCALHLHGETGITTVSKTVVLRSVRSGFAYVLFMDSDMIPLPYLSLTT